MKKLYIIGSGGFGRETLWLAERMNQTAVSKGGEPVWRIEGFIDDNEALHGIVQDGYQVLGGCSYLGKLKIDVYTVIAIGTAKAKRAVAKKLSAFEHIRYATLIDPSVILSPNIKIGEGCIICAGTILTVDISIGNHVILNLDCTVGHDSMVGDYTTVYPSVNISGNAVIGECVELGTGAQIIQGKQVGRESIIGAGAVVIRNIPEKCTAVGSPAKVIKS